MSGKKYYVGGPADFVIGVVTIDAVLIDHRAVGFAHLTGNELNVVDDGTGFWELAIPAHNNPSTTKAIPRLLITPFICR